MARTDNSVYLTVLSCLHSPRGTALKSNTTPANAISPIGDGPPYLGAATAKGRYSYYAICCRIPQFPCDSMAFLYFLRLRLGACSYGGP